MARTPHDRFVQRVFSDPQHAAVVFRAVLPTALVGQLDFAAAELLLRLFTDEGLQERRSDFLFRVPLGSGEAYLLALLEHQSTVAPSWARACSSTSAGPSTATCANTPAASASRR